MEPSWSLGPARLLHRNKAPSTSVPWDQALCLQYLSLIEIRPFSFPNVPFLEPSVSSLTVSIGPRALPEVAGGWAPQVSQPAFPLLALCCPQGHSLPLPVPPAYPPPSTPSEKSRMASGPSVTFLHLGYIHGYLFPSVFSTCATPCYPFSELGDS